MAAAPTCCVPEVAPAVHIPLLQTQLSTSAISLGIEQRGDGGAVACGATHAHALEAHAKHDGALAEALLQLGNGLLLSRARQSAQHLRRCGEGNEPRCGRHYSSNARIEATPSYLQVAPGCLGCAERLGRPQRDARTPAREAVRVFSHALLQAACTCYSVPARGNTPHGARGQHLDEAQANRPVRICNT